jgi:hypothetical protein
MKIKLLACAFLFCAIVIQSCVDHDLPETEIDPCSAEVSFDAEVKPIVNTSCAISGCHDGSLGPDRNWTLFNAFQAKSSNVKDRITRPPGTPGHMPAVGSLTSDQIQTIVCWVDQGAQDN